MTPSCIQAIYGLPTTPTNPQPGNELVVPGFISENANIADLDVFLANFRPELRGSGFKIRSIDGGSNDQDPARAGIEANMVIQYLVGLTNGNPVTFVASGQSNINGFINLAKAVLDMNQPPTVLVIPYGFNEIQVAENSAKSLCNLFGQLGARGVSVIVSSGDGGVEGGSEGNNRCSSFVPTFPATCPYVTVVGGTQSSPEVGAAFSAGGFSNYFDRPSYQNNAVSSYLHKMGSTYHGRYNANGRAYPDVSAQAANILEVKGGRGILVQSTS